MSELRAQTYPSMQVSIDTRNPGHAVRKDIQGGSMSELVADAYTVLHPGRRVD